MMNNCEKALAAHREGDFTRARELYEIILTENPQHGPILYNYGLLLIAQDQTDLAITQLEQVLALHPVHWDALNNLGALLLKKDNFDQALQCFSTVITANPEHTEARNNLAATLLQLGRYFHAAQHYAVLLEKTPDDNDARYSYGTALLETGDYQEAIHQFEKIMPLSLNAQSNLGIAYLKKGEIAKAKTVFQAILAEHPNRPEIHYLYSALTGENTPNKPPVEYIQHLFDQYSRYYEQHVCDGLNYTVPHKLCELLEKNIEAKNLIILDLGCGTGLSGLPFKKYASILNGVDLSANMLKLAENKQIYDNLILQDLIECLKNNIKNNINNKYTLLLACDVFNYLGDFQELFKYCQANLAPNGLLLFSVELADVDTFQLQPSARYVHSEKYIYKIISDYNFDMISLEKTVIRTQNHQPVLGGLYLLGKSEKS